MTCRPAALATPKRMQNPGSYSRPTEQNLHFNKIHGCFSCTVKLRRADWHVVLPEPRPFSCYPGLPDYLTEVLLHVIHKLRTFSIPYWLPKQAILVIPMYTGLSITKHFHLAFHLWSYLIYQQSHGNTLNNTNPIMYFCGFFKEKIVTLYWSC